MNKRFITTLVACSVLAPQAYSQFTLLSNFSANQGGGNSAGEITAFDPGTDRLFVTRSRAGVHQINIFNLADPTTPGTIGTVDFSTTFGLAANMLGLSSVAVDPLGRFGVASLIPTDNTGTVGRVGFFNLSTGATLGTANVGYHPDSVSFSADGSKMIVVNEGEFKSGATNANGSISVFDVSGINVGNLGNLASLTATTRDFSAPNLAPGVSIATLRNSNLAAVGTSGAFINTVPVFNTAAPEAIEPEYATIIGDKVFVTLQDNNAIAEYDLNTNLWTAVTDLGTITQVIDGNDTNPTGGISITQTVKGLPMPDTVGSYTVNGKTYLVTANEGDARTGDDRDVSRFGDVSGNDNMNGLVDTNGPSNFLNTLINANNGVRSDAQLGRLNISRINGDTDADGKIDDPTMIGTRSMSIWEETETGLVRVSDTGSFFETYISLNDPTGWVDSRSDDKGPEPEGLTLGSINGVPYAFISMERTGSIFMFDITDPTSPSFVGYIRLASGATTPLRPEGMLFVSAVDSPNGKNLLIVGYEGDGTAATERVAVYEVVPEPSTYAAFGLGAIALMLANRLRRKGA